jgi:hypothetical protein
MTDTTPVAADPVFDSSTAAGRLRILWNSTADPGLVMTDDDIADVATVLDEHAEMSAEVERLRAELVAAKTETQNLNACLMLFLHRYGTTSFGEIDVQRAAAWLADVVAGWQRADKELHARRAHPAYEYATTEGQRKAFDAIDVPPDGDGWERNVDAGRPGEGWERFDYHEESYWRRIKPAALQQRVPNGGGTDGGGHE